jgi:hypothetical protein
MRERLARWNHRSLYAAVLLLGIGLEIAVALVATQLEDQLIESPWQWGPLLFVLSSCYLYVAGQVVDSGYGIGLIPSMSLVLLAAMLGWVALGLGFLFLVFLVVMALFGVIRTTLLLVWATVSPRPCPRGSA